MLTIRRAQFKAFEVVKPVIFIPIMIKRLAEKFPALAQLIGEEGLIKIIEAGIIKSKQYGIEIAYETGVFIEMSVFFGSAFDTDPLLKWAGEILKSKLSSPGEKIISLASEAMEFMNRTIADEMIYPVPQFNKIINTSFQELVIAFEHASQSEFSNFLKKCWPEKFNLLKPEDLDLLFSLSSGRADDYNFKSNEAKYYYTLLMFLLGHRFDMDPQYPWIVELLNDPQYDEEFYKASSLHFTVQHLFRELMEMEPITND
ncbi:hypothetical protein BH10BAC3_BH10BAC3_34970 [soil metagenome]